MSSICSQHSKSSGSHLSPTTDDSFEDKRKSGNWEHVPIAPERIRSAAEAGFGRPANSESFVRSSTLRMSYQQATGHLSLLSDDESEISQHRHRYIQINQGLSSFSIWQVVLRRLT